MMVMAPKAACQATETAMAAQHSSEHTAGTARRSARDRAAGRWQSGKACRSTNRSLGHTSSKNTTALAGRTVWVMVMAPKAACRVTETATATAAQHSSEHTAGTARSSARDRAAGRWQSGKACRSTNRSLGHTSSKNTTALAGRTALVMVMAPKAAYRATATATATRVSECNDRWRSRRRDG